MSETEEIARLEAEEGRDPFEVLGVRPDPEGLAVYQKAVWGSRVEKFRRELREGAVRLGRRK